MTNYRADRRVTDGVIVDGAVSQLPLDVLQIGGNRPDYGKIDLTALYQRKQLAQIGVVPKREIDRDAVIALDQIGKHRRGPIAVQRGDPQRESGRIVRGVEELCQLFILPLDNAEMINDCISFRRGDHAGGRADKQRKPQLPLDLLDGMAQVGLGYIEIPRGLAERAGIRNLHRVKKLFNLHNLPSVPLDLFTLFIYINRNYIFAVKKSQVYNMNKPMQQINADFMQKGGYTWSKFIL